VVSLEGLLPTDVLIQAALPKLAQVPPALHDLVVIIEVAVLLAAPLSAGPAPAPPVVLIFLVSAVLHVVLIAFILFRFKIN
jgi:hypothetical protein